MNYRKYEFDHVVLFLLISLQNKLTFSNLTDLDLREHLKSTQNVFFEFHFLWKIVKFLTWFFATKFKTSSKQATNAKNQWSELNFNEQKFNSAYVWKKGQNYAGRIFNS